MPTLTSFSLLAQRVSTFRSANQLVSSGEAFGWAILEAVLGLNPDEVVEAMKRPDAQSCAGTGQV